MVELGVPLSRISVGVEDLLRDGTREDITRNCYTKRTWNRKNICTEI